MDEAGFGLPVPLSVRRAQAEEERAEAQQARADKRALEIRVEARRAADLQMVVREAEARDEYIDPVALAAGRVRATASPMRWKRRRRGGNGTTPGPRPKQANAANRWRSWASLKTRLLAACPR
jgi:hypothetical protein